jgi:hypothetical protein
MMAGAKTIDQHHREKGFEQTHTWDNNSKTCTPIIRSPIADSEMQLLHPGDKGESSDDEAYE